MVAWRRLLACAFTGLLLVQVVDTPGASAVPAAVPKPGRPAGASDSAPGQRAGAPLSGSHRLDSAAGDTALKAKGGPAAKRPPGAVAGRTPVAALRRPAAGAARKVKPAVREVRAAGGGYDARTSRVVGHPDEATTVYANTDGTMTALISAAALASDQVGTDGDTFVMSGEGDQSGSFDLQVGTQDGGKHIGRAYLSFGDLSTKLKNKYVNGAALTLYNTWSDSCTAAPVTVYSVSQSWSPSSLRWPGAAVNQAYETRSFAHKAGAGCDPAWESLQLDADDATGWTHGGTFRGLSVRAANEKSNAGFKRFAAAQSVNPPLLSVTYANEGAAYAVDEVTLPTNNTAGQVIAKVTNQGSSTWAAGGAFKLGVVVKKGTTTVATSAKVAPSAAIAPMGTGTITVPIPAVAPADYTVELQMYDAAGTAFQTAYGVPIGTFPLKVSNVLPAVNFEQPGNGDEVESITPTLYAEGVDPDKWPAGATLQYDYKICSGTAEAPTNCVSSGWTGQTWTPPALRWSSTYYWWVRAHDSSAAGPYTGPLALTTRVPQPAITASLAGNPEGDRAPGVDAAIGNYSTVATDASVDTVGPDLTITRTYNSLDPRRGNAFGAGWASRVDTALAEDRVAGSATLPSVVVTLPTGRQVRFGRNTDGSYAPPQGQALTLVRDDTTATWTMRDGTGGRMVFDALGRLTTLIDDAGLRETLRYDTADHVVEIRNEVSGRKLTLAWTGAHVTQVRAGDGPAWTYAYTGDRLTSVCGPDPAPNCTTYSYGDASHYRSAVLNDAPRGYWRFGETSGSTAANSTARSPGDDAGTYTGVVLNADGALGGTGDRAAVFDGVSSRVTLPAKVTTASMSAAVEMWFKTTESGVLLSYQNGQPYPAAATAWTPVLYVGADGLLYGGFSVPKPTGPRQAVSDAAVNDGAWHHAVLSAAVDKQTLYVDGVAQQIQAAGPVDHRDQIQFTVGAGQGKNWPATNGEGFHFDGAIDELALYTRPLSALAVANHYAAAARIDVLTGITLPQDARRFATIGYDDSTDRVRTLTDAWGRQWRLDAPTRNGGTGAVALHGPYPDWTYTVDYDHGNRLVSVAHNGASKYYDYNAAGFLSKITDANNHAVGYTTDDRGNVLSTQTCRAAGACNTSYATYYRNAADPLDPRNDKVTSKSDARSSGPTDTTYRTSYEYDTAGRITKVTTPAPSGASAAPSQKWTYSTGSEAAEGGGTVPAGLLLSQTGKRGQLTAYAYRATGDLSTESAPTGLRTTYTYDSLGRVTTTTTGNDGGATFGTTAYTYTPGGAIATETGPAVRNPISGITHQKITTYAYDGDGHTLSVTDSDATPVANGGDPARTTSYGYDAQGRPARTVTADQQVSTTAYSADGLTVTKTDPAGTKMIYVYDDEQRPLTTTAEGRGVDPQNPSATSLTLEWRGYDPAGRLVQTQDAMGRITRTSYYDDDLPAETVRAGYRSSDGKVRDVPLTRITYDAAGQATQRVEGGVTSTFTYDPSGALDQQIVDPAALKRTTTYEHDADGNPVKVTETGAAQAGRAEVTTNTYGPDNQVTTSRVQLADGGELVTGTTFDERGLPRSTRDARLLTTDITYDAYGRQSTSTAPAVDTWTAGTQTKNVRPVATTGYNTFGEVTHAKDVAGAVSTTGYDVMGRVRTFTGAAYAPPGNVAITPVTSFEYDTVGNNTKVVDPLQRATSSTFDPYGNILTTTEPQVGDQPSTTVYRYDRNGEPVSTTTPSGAQSLSTYDELGQVATQTAVEREPGPTSYLISYLDYDDGGRPIRTTSAQQRVTRMTYNGAGELATVTDPAGRVSSIDYDIAGRVLAQTDSTGLTTATSYDLAGRAIGAQQRRGDTVLRTTSAVLDPNGNTTTEVSAEGRRSVLEYDAVDRLVAKTTTVDANTTIRVESGYDVAGRRTRYVDGNKHVTNYTYNIWGLTESIVEPATAATPDAAQRTWTNVYDAAGQQVATRLPGGVVRTQEFDAQGRPTVERGTGADAATADRVIGYDADNRVIRIGGAAGDTTYRYDDRGNLVQSAGAAGTATWAYSGDGELTTRTDAAGTATFTYDSAGRRSSFTDPVTKRTVDYAYDSSGRLGTVTDRAVSKTVKRVLGYDQLNRVASDRVEQTVNVGLPARVLLGDDYGYDLDDNVTATTSYQPTGSTANTYTYDGAGRLRTWAAGGTTTQYEFDAAGNRVKAGSASAVYNERNQLVDDGVNTYSYTPRGTLDTVTPKSGTAKDYRYDAFERLIQDGSASYGYDALDRVATRNSVGGMTYAGLTNDLVSDSTRVVSRDADGTPFADRATGAATGKMLYADQHGDVTGRYLSSSAGDTRTYDPFGKVSGATGETPAVGYQGGWTDAASGAVNMASRWYDPSTGGFLSADTWTNEPDTDGNANRYAYANGDPVDNADTNGHWFDGGGGSGTGTLPRTPLPSGPVLIPTKKPERIVPRSVTTLSKRVPYLNVVATFWDTIFEDSTPTVGSCQGPNGKILEAGMSLCNPATWCGRGYTNYCTGTQTKGKTIWDIGTQIRDWIKTKVTPELLKWLADQLKKGGDNGREGGGSGQPGGGGGPGGGGNCCAPPPPPPPPPWIPPLFKKVRPPSPAEETDRRIKRVTTVSPKTNWIDPGPARTNQNISVTDPALLPTSPLLIQFKNDGGSPWLTNNRLHIWDASATGVGTTWSNDRDKCMNGSGYTTSAIRYWGLNPLNDSSGADACFRGSTPSGGTKATATPRGFVSGTGMARGHLIGKDLGGNGQIRQNVTPLYQNLVNSSAMYHGVEQVVKKWANAGTVYYRVIPDYGTRTDGIPNNLKIVVATNTGALLIQIDNRP